MLVQHHIKILEENLKVFDTILAKRKYMAGDRLTLVDFFYLPLGSMLAEVSPSPHVMSRSATVCLLMNLSMAYENGAGLMI